MHDIVLGLQYESAMNFHQFVHYGIQFTASEANTLSSELKSKYRNWVNSDLLGAEVIFHSAIRKLDGFQFRLLLSPTGNPRFSHIYLFGSKAIAEKKQAVTRCRRCYGLAEKWAQIRNEDKAETGNATLQLIRLAKAEEISALEIQLLGAIVYESLFESQNSRETNNFQARRNAGGCFSEGDKAGGTKLNSSWLSVVSGLISRK